MLSMKFIRTKAETYQSYQDLDQSDILVKRVDVFSKN